jgi:CRP-like cAMP-binding protein
VAIEPEEISRRIEAVQPHPLAELLACPPATGNLLNGSAQCLDFDAGETVFRQNGPCRGLYVVVSGQFLRKTERLEMRLTLGPARAGELVELAAVLGDGRHTYSLTAQTPGSVLLLPEEALNLAFQEYPPLRMQLLEELAREVSRAYVACCLNRTVRAHRQGSGEALA